MSLAERTVYTGPLRVVRHTGYGISAPSLPGLYTGYRYDKL